MREQFVSEAIRPVAATSDTRRMASGEPGLPQEFVWRGQSVTVARVLRSWRETGPCHHGSGEAYIRKHWYEIVTSDRVRMKLYFERLPRAGKARARWWLFSIEAPDSATARKDSAR